MSSKPVRIGMVGTGTMGQNHVQGLSKIAGAKIVALCDLDEQMVSSVAEPVGAKAYTDFEKMLADEDLDALYICVAPHQHGNLEIHAAQKGLHLYVEKPVSLYPDQALKVGEVIRKSGVMTQVGYQMRYFPQNRQAKQFLSDKEIGTAHTYRWGSVPNKAWWRRYNEGGGQLVEQTTHHVDMLRWILGEVTAVSATYSFNRLLRDEKNLTVPDTQVAILQFASGASATVSNSCALGDSWSMGFSYAVRNAKVTVLNDGIQVEPTDVYPIPPLPTNVMTADEAFVHAVATGDRSHLLSPYDDGIKTAAVTLAANLSAENGGRVVQMKELLGSFV